MQLSRLYFFTYSWYGANSPTFYLSETEGGRNKIKEKLFSASSAGTVCAIPIQGWHVGRGGRHNQTLKSRKAQRDEMKMGNLNQSHT